VSCRPNKLSSAVLCLSSYLCDGRGSDDLDLCLIQQINQSGGKHSFLFPIFSFSVLSVPSAVVCPLPFPSCLSLLFFESKKVYVVPQTNNLSWWRVNDYPKGNKSANDYEILCEFRTGRKIY